MSDYNVVSSDNDTFFQTEGGVYVPKPTDLKRCVQLGTDKGFTLVEFDTVHEAVEWMQDCLNGKISPVLNGDPSFFEAVNPIMGEPVLLSINYLYSVTNIGYTWQDLEAYEAANVQRRQAKLHMMAQKAASRNALSKGGHRGRS